MSFDPSSAVADEPAGFDPSTAEFDAESAAPEPRRGGTRAEAKPYVPADDGMRPGEAGAGRGRVNPPLAIEPAPAPDMPQGPGAALATIRENQQARDQRLNAPQPAPGSRSVFDGATVQVPEQTGGFTPQEMAEGSIAPWKREETRRMGEYLAPTNPAVMTEGEAGLSQRAGQSVMDATANPRLAAAARGATDAALIAPEAMATGAKLAADIANLGTLGAAQPVSDWLGMTIKAVQDSKSPRYQELRGEFGRLLQDPNAGVLDVVAFMASNPAFTVEVGAPSVPSMLLGAQGARIGMALAGKGAAETGATLGATAANVGMNAGSTFSDTQGDLGQKLAAAGAAGAGTALLGRMGGAETALATGRAAGLGGVANVAMREGGQEFGESLSQSLGQGTAEGNFDLGTAVKQAASEGVIGGVLGGAAGAMAGEKPVRPTERRRAIDDRLDDFAATHGVLPKAIAALKEQAARRPLADVAGFYKRGIAALARRGLVGGQVDDGALSQLDEPPPLVKETAPEVSRKAVAPEVPLAPLDVATAAPEPVAPEQALEDSLADRLGIADPEAAPAPPPPTSTQDLAGQPINRNWTAFTPESGTLNLPREQLPQIKAEHRGALVNFLGARGITHETDAEVDPASLKPTQGEFSPAKVQQAREFVGGDRSILVSADGYVLDGHHQWLAKLDAGEPVKAIRLNAPIQDLLRLAHQFPSSTTARGASRAAPINAGAPSQPAAGVAVDGGPTAAPAPSTFRVLTRAGRTPNSTEPIELRPNEDGSLTPFMGGKAMLDFNSGDPIMIPAGASDLDAKKAIRDAGAVSNRTNFYPATKGAAPAPEPAAPPPAPPAAPPAVAATPAPAPKPKRTAPVRGSNALGQISARLGGISPDLLADLSDKAQRTRTGKTGKQTQYTAWDNPLHQGHGPLFRKGGSADLSEIARVLEEEGYLAPGSVERDPIAASQRAQEIIRAELKQGGSTLREGDPAAVEAEMERRREAAQDVPDDILAPLTDEDLAEAGYAGAAPEVKEAVERLMADAEAAGIDTETLRDDAARATEGLTEDEYHARLQAAIREALDAGRQDRGGAAQAEPEAAQRGGEDRGQADGGEGQEDRPDLELTAPTRAEVLAQQAALEREQADRDAPADKPPSQLTGEQVDAFNTQGSVFDQPAEAPAPPPQPEKAEKQAPKSERLTDAGEELIRNRRGKLKGLAWDDVSAMNDTLKVAQVVKANVWPRPDYAKMVEDGAPAWKAAALKAVYDKLAAAPVTRTAPTDADLRAYIETMQAVREALTAELDRVASLPDGAELWKSIKAANVFGKVFSVPADAKPLYGAPSAFDRRSEQGKENNRRALLIGGNNAIQALQFGYKTLGKIKDLLAEGFPAKQEAWQKSWEVRATETRDNDVPKAERTGQPQQRFYVYEKGSRWRLAKGGQDGGYATQEQAEAFARSLTQKKREQLPPSRGLDLADVKRTGPDWRGGKNVTAKDIMDHFGFRGVNLGEYVKAKQSIAQLHLNHVYDAMSDLADLLGVPPKAMSLNGTLGVAIGAQGSGKALAHFVPGVNEINITRDSGAGALAHEFGHAVDHYFATQHGRAASMAKRPYLSAAIEGMSDAGGVRPEVIEAMRFVMRTINTRPMTEAEAKKYMADQRELNQRRLDRWVKEFKGNKGADPAALDAVAEKLKRGDVGEPQDADVEANLAEFMRAAGLKPGNAIAANAFTTAYRLRDLADEARFLASHIPQQPTDYARASDAMDAKKPGDGYWSTPWEKFARAFETFAMDALKDRERESLYLSGLVDSEGWRDWAESTGKSIPYPAGAERLAMQQAFQNLVDALQTRETDSGVMLYDLSRVGDRIMRMGYERQDPERIQAARNLASLIKRLDEGKITPAYFEVAVRSLAERMDRVVTTKAANRLMAERERGPDYVRERLLRARRQGDLDETTVEFALWVLDQNPALATNLAVSVRSAKNDSAAGDYNPAAEIMRLFKGSSNEDTAVHEILHHAERMMPADMQSEVRKEWAAALAKAVKKATPEQREALELIGPALAGDQAAYKALARAIQEGPLNYADHYQLVNPSEYWAVNGARLMGNRFLAKDSIWQRVRNWFREMEQKIRGLLGLRSDAPLLRALNRLTDPEQNQGDRQSPEMLSDRKAVKAMGDVLADPQSPEAAALRALSEDDELFALPKSAATTMEAITFDTSPLIKIRKTDLPGTETMWTLTMPDGRQARITVRKPGKYGPSPYSADFDGVGYNWNTERPGDNPDDVDPDTEDVWIDVSQLKGQGDGAKVYNIASTFAHNTGRIFIGDPNGVSPDAMRRRPAHMLSSALKFGTTRHLAPHPDQVRGSKNDGIPPLQWVYGDDLGNIRRLVDLNIKLLENDAPTSKNLDFDVNTGSFIDVASGRRVSVDAIGRSVARARSVGGEGLPASLAGRATVERVALLRALLREEGSGVEGQNGRRDGLLARLVRLSAVQPDATRKLFYSLKQPAGAKAEPPAESTPRAIQRKLQDQFNRFTVIRDWAVEQGLNMTPDSNVWAYEERMHGRIATRVEDFREKTVKPKIQAIQKAGFTMAQVAEYLHAQHAEERNKQIESIDPTNTAGSGMTTADAKAILAAADPKLAALANDFRKITEDTKAILLKAGIVSKDMTDAWEAAYKNYVPLKGGDEAAQQGTGKGLAANGRQKRALGHGERAEFVVENILRDHERAITVAEKNLVGHSLLTFIADLGREDIATIGQPEKRKVLKNSTDYEVLDGNGARIAIFDSQAGAAAFISKHSQPGLFASLKGPLIANPVRGDPSVAFMATPMLADNEVNVYVKGHAIRVQLNDPLLAQAYTRSGQEGLNQLMAMNREINAYLSKVYTGYNPEFLLTNIARDLTTGIINITGKYGAGLAAKALGNYPKAFASLWRYAMTGKETPDIKAYRDAGGSTGASYLSDIERIGKDVQEAYDEYKGAVETYRDRGALPAARAAANRWLGRFLLAPIRHINEAGENAMRLAVFQAVRDTPGNSINDAASAAKNVTVNFNRRGEWGQVLGSMYLFFNPAIQGTAAIADSLVNGKNKGQAIALTGSLGVLAYMLAAGQFGGGDDDDEAWAAIPDYVKDKNIVIRTGEKTYITIPIPYGYGFFYALGNATYDLQKGSRDIDKIALKIASNLLEHFSPIGNPLGGDKPEARGLVELIPGAVGGELQRDLVRLMANRNGMGSDIVPDSPFDEGKPDSMKVFRSTKGTLYDKTARTVNELTGGTESQAGGISVSPETLKYWTHTVTGGAGAFISDSVGLAGLGARYLYNSGDPDKGDLRPEFKEIPIFRRFAKEEGVQDRRRVFWAAAGEVREAQADLKRAKKIHDDAGEGKVWAQRGELVAMGAYLESVSKMVKAQRDLVDEVMADQTTSLAYKRARVRALEKEEQMLYDEFTREFVAEKAKAKTERAATP